MMLFSYTLDEQQHQNQYGGSQRVMSVAATQDQQTEKSSLRVPKDIDNLATIFRVFLDFFQRLRQQKFF